MAKYKVDISIMLIAGLVVVAILGSFGANQIREVTGEERAVKEAIINYCIAAKANDKKNLAELITKTPKYYWNRSAEKISIEKSEGFATEPESNSDFAEVNYSNLLIKPLAWRGLAIPDAETLKVRVNGDYAIVRASLKSQGSFAFENDFLLVRDHGKWKIFKIDLPLSDQTFPFKDRLAFPNDGDSDKTSK